MFGFKKGMAQLDGRDRAWAKEISQKTCAEEAVNAAKKDSPSRVDFILKNYRKHLAEQTWDIIQAAVDNNSGRVMQMLADKYSGLFFRNIWPDGNTKDLNNLLQAASEKGSFRTWLPVYELCDRTLKAGRLVAYVPDRQDIANAAAMGNSTEIVTDVLRDAHKHLSIYETQTISASMLKTATLNPRPDILRAALDALCTDGRLVINTTELGQAVTKSLIAVARQGSLEKTRMLLERGAEDKDAAALRAAATGGFEDIAALLATPSAIREHGEDIRRALPRDAAFDGIDRLLHPRPVLQDCTYICSGDFNAQAGAPDTVCRMSDRDFAPSRCAYKP